MYSHVLAALWPCACSPVLPPFPRSPPRPPKLTQDRHPRHDAPPLCGAQSSIAQLGRLLQRLAVVGVARLHREALGEPVPRLLPLAHLRAALCEQEPVVCVEARLEPLGVGEVRVRLLVGRLGRRREERTRRLPLEPRQPRHLVAPQPDQVPRGGVGGVELRRAVKVLLDRKGRLDLVGRRAGPRAEEDGVPLVRSAELGRRLERARGVLEPVAQVLHPHLRLWVLLRLGELLARPRGAPQELLRCAAAGQERRGERLEQGGEGLLDKQRVAPRVQSRLRVGSSRLRCRLGNRSLVSRRLGRRLGRRVLLGEALLDIHWERRRR
mmetsp:Transcript_31833/g.105372  ORF Transcript_31833/g.105372 Transcript_31833/m.105372 type:complete len:324 (-) Transcript_31833:309-1280(-)